MTTEFETLRDLEDSQYNNLCDDLYNVLVDYSNREDTKLQNSDYLSAVSCIYAQLVFNIKKQFPDNAESISEVAKDLVCHVIDSKEAPRLQREDPTLQ